MVPCLSIAKHLQRKCAGRAFGAGISLVIGQLVQIKGLLRVVRGLPSDINRPAINRSKFFANQAARLFIEQIFVKFAASRCVKPGIISGRVNERAVNSNQFHYCKGGIIG